MGDVLMFPQRPQMTALTGDPFLDRLELMMIRMALNGATTERLRGLASARELYARTHKKLPVELPNSECFLTNLVQVTAQLTDQQRSTLHHPATSRSSAQRVLAS